MATNELEIDVTLDAKSAMAGLEKLKKGAEEVGRVCLAEWVSR